VFGYLPDGVKPESLQVWADANGIVYLPAIGCLHTPVRGRMLLLKWHEGQAELEEGGSTVPFELRPLETIPGTSLLLYPHDHPLFQKLFRRLPEGDPVAFEEPAERLKGALAKGFRIIKKVNPKHFEELNRECVQAVILENENINSMASLHIHGGVLFSTRAENDEIFFAEDIIHQGGHVNFNAVTVEPTRIFTIPGGTQICVFTTADHDKRSISTALHGNFTLARMCQFFDECLSMNLFSGRQEHELIGRFALAWDRFKYGLEIIDDKRLYTEDGFRIHQLLMDVYQDIFPRRQRLLEKQDLSNPPYVFRYALFREINPADSCRV